MNQPGPNPTRWVLDELERINSAQTRATTLRLVPRPETTVNEEKES